MSYLRAMVACQHFINDWRALEGEEVGIIPSNKVQAYLHKDIEGDYVIAMSEGAWNKGKEARTTILFHELGHYIAGHNNVSDLEQNIVNEIEADMYAITRGYAKPLSILLEELLTSEPNRHPDSMQELHARITAVSRFV